MKHGYFDERELQSKDGAPSLRENGSAGTVTFAQSYSQSVAGEADHCELSLS